jgi:hypothetical protein
MLEALPEGRASFLLSTNTDRISLELKPLLGEKLQASIYHLRIIEDAPIL